MPYIIIQGVQVCLPWYTVSNLEIRDHLILFSVSLQPTTVDRANKTLLKEGMKE